MQRVVFSVELDRETTDNLEILTYLAGGHGIESDVIKTVIELGVAARMREEGFLHGVNELGADRRRETRRGNRPPR